MKNFIDSYALGWIIFLKKFNLSTIKIYSEVSAIKIALTKIPNLLKILSRSESEKSKEFFNKILMQDFATAWIDFFGIIVDDQQILSIPKILTAIILRLEKKLKIESGILISVIPLSAAQILKIEKKTSVIRQKIVILTNKIDTQLIGGLRIELNEHVWDNSLIEQLKQLRTILTSSNLTKKFIK